MFLLFSLNKIKKFFYNIESRKIYFVILIIQSLILLLEMIIAHYIYQYKFDYYIYLKLVFMSLIISYPLLLIFSKIDNSQ